MTLLNFIAEETKRIKDFEQYWMEQRKQDPENYPLEMNEGDWDEQLMIFNP